MVLSLLTALLLGTHIPGMGNRLDSLIDQDKVRGFLSRDNLDYNLTASGPQLPNGLRGPAAVKKESNAYP